MTHTVGHHLRGTLKPEKPTCVLFMNTEIHSKKNENCIRLRNSISGEMRRKTEFWRFTYALSTISIVFKFLIRKI